MWKNAIVGKVQTVSKLRVQVEDMTLKEERTITEREQISIENRGKAMLATKSTAETKSNYCKVFWETEDNEKDEEGITFEEKSDNESISARSNADSNADIKDSKTVKKD